MPRKKGFQKERQGFKKGESLDLSCNDQERKSSDGLVNLKKYEKRVLESNWEKYKIEPEPQNSCQEDNISTSDFSLLVKNASSDCSHFEFNSEKLWKKKENAAISSEMFNLDLHVLSCGLACLPLYDKLNFDMNLLSASEKAIFDEEAKKNWKVYNPVRQKFLEKQGTNKLRSSFRPEEKKEGNKSFGMSSGCYTSVNSEQKNENGLGGLHGDSLMGSICAVSQSQNELSQKQNAPSKHIFKEENLEDWLDSILDH